MKKPSYLAEEFIQKARKMAVLYEKVRPEYCGIHTGSPQNDGLV